MGGVTVGGNGAVKGRVDMSGGRRPGNVAANPC